MHATFTGEEYLAGSTSCEKPVVNKKRLARSKVIRFIVSRVLMLQNNHIIHCISMKNNVILANL